VTDSVDDESTGDALDEEEEHDEEEYDGDEYDDGEDDFPASRRRLRLAVAAGIIALVGLGLGLGLTLTGSSGASSGPEGVPLQHAPDLASANTTVSGVPVDGITCRKSMQQNVAYHIHVHVNIFVNGLQQRLPAGAGIVPPRSYQQLPGGQFVDNSFNGCLYWLHVHADDGIIHVESPTEQTFVLGQFFDVWGQPLSPSQVGPARGPVVAFENGQRFVGNPRNIPLTAQAVIQLDVGTPEVAFKPMKFAVVGGLCSTSCSAPPTS
jgi:hypothetical protein